MDSHLSHGNVNSVCSPVPAYAPPELTSTEGINEYFVTAPGSWDTFFALATAAGQEVEFHMLDTPGQEDYDRLRTLIYPGMSSCYYSPKITGILETMFSRRSETQQISHSPGPSIFSLAPSASIDPAKSCASEQWIGEVRHFLPKTPIILVGNKQDLEHDPGTIAELRKYSQRPVTYEEVSKDEYSG